MRHPFQDGDRFDGAARRMGHVGIRILTATSDSTRLSTNISRSAHPLWPPNIANQNGSGWTAPPSK